MSFEKSSLIYSRYNSINRPKSHPELSSDDDQSSTCTSKEYAAFLKEKERKVGPEGFLDSDKHSYPYLAKKNRETGQNKSGRSAPSQKPSVVSLSQKIEKDKKDHERTMKSIEDNMWRHKQDERALKRTEGDVIKNQRAVRHTLRDYHTVINKKKYEEEKKLKTELEKYTVLQREHTHNRERTTKNRIQLSMNADQINKDVNRKYEVKVSDLSRKCIAKMSEIELKQVEVLRLNSEYESKMQAKEKEQNKLKQELAELANALNMESMKCKEQMSDLKRQKKSESGNRIDEDIETSRSLDNKLMKSAGDSKAAETNKRKLSADLLVTKEHLAIKHRDEQRRMTDTQMRLADNTARQRKLNEDARHAEMDLKAKEIEQKIEAHNNRRINLLHNNMKQKKEKEEEQQAIWEARFRKRHEEQEKKEYEDSLKFYQKMVNKGEETEQLLYGKVRNAEYNRQKQEQNVRRLQQALHEMKRENAVKLKDEIASRQKEELELNQMLQREKAELEKTHAEREQTYLKLQKHRKLLMVDKENMVSCEKLHSRKMKIGAKNDSAMAEAY